jgi:hypothetical protein
MPLGPRAAGIFSKRYAPPLAIERHRCKARIGRDFSADFIRLETGAHSVRATAQAPVSASNPLAFGDGRRLQGTFEGGPQPDSMGST